MHLNQLPLSLAPDGPVSVECPHCPLPAPSGWENVQHLLGMLGKQGSWAVEDARPALG